MILAQIMLRQLPRIDSLVSKHKPLLNRWIALTATAMILCCANAVAAQEKVIEDLRSIRALSPSEALGKLVDFQATVTYIDGMREFLFVQEGRDAIFVHRPNAVNVTHNQRVRIRGTLAKGDLLPIVADATVTPIGAGTPANAEPVSVIGIEHDCRYLSFEFDILQTNVSATNTLLYAKSALGKQVFIEIQHSDGISLPNVFQIAGSRVRCSGVLGLQIAGDAFKEPGDSDNRITGYKIFCSSNDAIKIVSKDNGSASSQSEVIGLSFIEADNFPEGRFLTFAQICLIDQKVPKGLVVSDGPSFKRFELHSTEGLKTGMLIRVGGMKFRDPDGKDHCKVDYLRHLAQSEFPKIEPISVEQAVNTFEPDRRIAVEGKPLRIEYRGNLPHLILGQGKSTLVVEFQDSGNDCIGSLDPSIAKSVRITGVTKTGKNGEKRLVAVRPDDTQLIESRTSISRMVALGLGTLMGICALAAIWIKLLKSQVAQKQQFEAIFDNAGCPILVFNGNLDIIDANQLTADLTGYSKKQLRGLKISDIDKQIPPETVKEQIVQTMIRQEVATFQTKLHAQDGTNLDVEVHCRNLTQSDDPEKATFIAIFPDITARKEYEKELEKARDEAINANNAKSRFVASMSHELRTPLNGVIGMTRLLEGTDLTQAQADYLAACRTSGETLLTVIGDVLDFSKMEAGKLQLDPQETKLIPFVENLVRATSLQSGARNVDLASFVDPRLARSFMVDSDRLRQVLFNLIGNAVKFTSDGSITVTVKCGQINDHYADVRFVVSDTGIGIPEARIDGLFEAFEQFDNSTARQFGGTGLGLTICRQIVELMDGRIYAQSEFGEGSDFIVEVRLPFASQDGQKSEIENDIVPTTKRLAVVGMSDPVAKLLQEMVQAYQVDASFFSEADILPTGEFDLVFLNNNGDLETARTFVSQQPALLSHDAPMLIPVVPPDCVVEPQQWEALGARQTIYKPFTQTRFLQPLSPRPELGQSQDAERTRKANFVDREMRVLVCEDNAVNQMVVREVCRGAGIDVVIRENGQTGIQTLLIDSKFDAIFMDCHMPVMDGFEAAGRIRELTQAGTIPKIPVIALTANALASDRDKCLEAGMDDYLAKPFEIEDFLAVLQAHTIAPSEATASTDVDKPASGQSIVPVFDIENLVSQFNDRVFALEIAELFASTLPEFKAELQESLILNDIEQTLGVAHRLKGSAATVKASRISGLALEIESAARDSQLDQIESQLAELLSEFDNFVNAVREQSPVG